MVFAAEFAAIGRVSTGVFAASRCWHASSVDAGPAPQDLVMLAEVP
jgi:hypothetical protein